MMWAVMMLMIFLYTPAYTNEARNQCNTLANTTLSWSLFNNCSVVILKNKNIAKIETNKESHYGNLTKLDISNNHLEGFPEGFLSNAITLKEVRLEGNILKSLPDMFLINSTSLQILKLEGNPLSKIPASVFHGTLANLTVDCRCDLVSNIMMHLNGNATKYSGISAMCQLSSQWTSLKNFYEENCGKQYLALYIALPILVVGLIVGGLALYIWKRKKGSTSLENKGVADKSPAHGQPRYMSRNMEGTATTSSPGQRQDYENVFVGHVRTTEVKPYGYLDNEHEPGTHSTHIGEEDIYLESDINEGDQPIYTNTQGIYYNYAEPGFKSKNKEDDDVYILPDQ